LGGREHPFWSPRKNGPRFFSGGAPPHGVVFRASKKGVGCFFPKFFVPFFPESAPFCTAFWVRSLWKCVFPGFSTFFYLSGFWAIPGSGVNDWVPNLLFFPSFGNSSLRLFCRAFFFPTLSPILKVFSFGAFQGLTLFGFF